MTTISKTTFTFVVLHRTDEPFESYLGDDGPYGGPLGEAMQRAYDGNAVGLEVDQETVEVADGDVVPELIALGNDGMFFDDDLGVES